MLLCMAYLRRTSQVAALAYSNFFFSKAGIIYPASRVASILGLLSCS